MVKTALLVTIAVGLLVVTYNYFNHNESNNWLTSPQSSRALTHQDAIGFDFINCTKVKMNQRESGVALSKLTLQKIENQSNLDSAPANCDIEWWNIDFPSEAMWFSLSSNGSIRQLATVKAGYVYYIYEVR